MEICPDQGVSAMINQRQPGSPGKALWRGFTMRCPGCAHGDLFRRYLKVVEYCPTCGEDFSFQRAYNFPAYLVTLVIGPLTTPAVLYTRSAVRRRDFRAGYLAAVPDLAAAYCVWGDCTPAAHQRSSGGVAVAAWNARVRAVEE